jgi:hypothetical protein
MPDQPALTEIFEQIGAPDPEAWARSQEDEGIPQLARFLFLRQAWKQVIPKDDLTWIDAELQTPAGSPGAAAAPALSRLLSLGADKQDIATIVRTMQWQLLFRLCYLLDDPGDLEDVVSELAWGLFTVDEAGNPLERLEGLHESVLETEPSGTEMKS